MTSRIDRWLPLPRSWCSRSGRFAAGGTLVLVAALSACGSSAVSSAARAMPSSTATPPSTTTTSVLNGAVAVAFPVVECTSPTGASLGDEGWKPSILLAPIPTALVGKVEFYSDDVHTVLGPVGWSCAQTRIADGGTGLVVYPSSNPNPPVNGPPPPGTEGIFATFDTTADVAGIALVCPYFSVASWQSQEARCPASPPAGEQNSMPTPDVVSLTDPAGVVGGLEGSGGTTEVVGTVIFPQVEPAVTDGSAIDVAEESCSLPDPGLCATVLSDFDVRDFPVPTSGYSGSSGSSGYRSSGAPDESAGPTTSPGSATATRPGDTHTPVTTAPAVTQTTGTAVPPATQPTDATGPAGTETTLTTRPASG